MPAPRSIPCLFMRAGTSRGPFFLASDLPADAALRDRILLEIMGSGHPLQIDGLGGGNPLTSKVAIVDRSPSPDADVDYLFAQVSVLERTVDTRPNCGNMLAGVGGFALHRGLVEARHPVTPVRIRNLNTGKLVEALLQTPGRRLVYEGAASIDGVPGRGAPIRLSFVDAEGSKTGRLLPTGAPLDSIHGVDVSCVDMAMPVVLIAAAAVGKSGAETPAQLDGDPALLARLEEIRLAAAQRMGMEDAASSVVPKLVLLSPPRAGGTLQGRYFMPWSCHSAFATTGAVCVASACAIPGTVAHRLAPVLAHGAQTVVLEHPAGRIPVELAFDGRGRIERASIIRTARLLFEGTVHVPQLSEPDRPAAPTDPPKEEDRCASPRC